ncbi:uncharacterized protein SCHCODRAFT_01234856 [Schizophyllum commune H4-8]|uniref:uncharacterized protein n=1 Tax=Schizophyllum commune (strain H4-8 / FGSC 9210) TaxID=578458 RepID=UPI0021603458|nr:uncharacterized protein SCHCODRAFT_01234856 [Schizophyllum commune H4-8]KAI5897781.1 hypothetical protein SCHCODRAFT_01234856 [Schizophyllum commune H4-8]
MQTRAERRAAVCETILCAVLAVVVKLYSLLYSSRLRSPLLVLALTLACAPACPRLRLRSVPESRLVLCTPRMLVLLLTYHQPLLNTYYPPSFVHISYAHDTPADLARGMTNVMPSNGLSTPRQYHTYSRGLLSGSFSYRMLGSCLPPFNNSYPSST